MTGFWAIQLDEFVEKLGFSMYISERERGLVVDRIVIRALGFLSGLNSSGSARLSVGRKVAI